MKIGLGARWGRVSRTLYGWGLAISSGDSGRFGGREPTSVASPPSTSSRTRTRMSTRVAGYVLAQPAEFLRRWGKLVERASGEVSAFLYLGARAAPFAQATIVHAGDDVADATRALQPFLTLPGLVGQQAQLTAYPNVLSTTDVAHSGQQSAFAGTVLVDHLDRHHGAFGGCCIVIGVVSPAAAPEGECRRTATGRRRVPDRLAWPRRARAAIAADRLLRRPRAGVLPDAPAPGDP